MMPQPYHSAGGRGSSHPSQCRNQGAVHGLRCRHPTACKVQEAGCGARVKGAGSGLLADPLPPRIFTRGDTYIPNRTQKVRPPPVGCAGRTVVGESLIPWELQEIQDGDKGAGEIGNEVFIGYLRPGLCAMERKRAPSSQGPVLPAIRSPRYRQCSVH